MTYRSLLYPRVQSIRNSLVRLDSSGWGKLLGGAVLVLGVWAGIYYGLVRLLQVCNGIELFGPYLVDRLLLLFFLAFSGVLLFSNIVASLATYYLSDELRLVVAAPVSMLRLFYAKLIETLVVSSWMLVVFGVPVILAYGTVHHAPWYFYAISVVVLTAFTLIPASIGIVITTVLVNIFPARRTRDLLVIVSAAFLGGAWMLFRALRPERLTNPDSFEGMAQFLGSFAVPETPLLPSTWAMRALTPVMRGQLGAGLEATGHLILWSAAFVFLAAWIAGGLYAGGWSRAQEGRPARFARLPSVQRVSTWLLGPTAGALAAKDFRVLVRDATQWSQLVLLVATTAIYLFSINALPFETLDFDTQTYRNSVAFANIGFTAFVQAAVAARFIYPAISAEGRGIWILRSSSARSGDILRSKWLTGAVPLVLLGVVLAAASNMILHTDSLVRVVAVGNAVLSAVVVSALAAGMGAVMPDFKAENAAKVAASFGGLVFMAASLTVVFILLCFQAYPTYQLYDSFEHGYTLQQRFWVIAGVGYGGSLVIGVAACWWGLRQGIRALDRLEL